jgi:transposase
LDTGVSFNFVSADRDQGFLMPPDVREWLPAGELAWFVIDAVGQMDLSEFRGRYRADGHGRSAYDPSLMVALLLFGYCDGERSSRVIERRCSRDVAYRVICGNLVPDHATIARFRAAHERALAGVFGQVLRLCAEAGLVKVGLVAIDGTKLTADAAGSANRTGEQLQEQIDRILGEAARVDATEDEQFGQARGDELPPELADRSSRLARLKQAKARIDAEDAALRAAQQAKIDRRAAARAAGTPMRGREPSPQIPKRVRREPARVNITDPDSQIMKATNRFVQGYNAQLAVGGGQIVLAADLTQCSADVEALHPMINAATDQLAAIGHDEPIRCVIADAGYASESNFTTKTRPILLVAVAREKEQTRRAAPGPRQRTWRGQTRQVMRRRLDTPAGRNLYRRRSPMVEPVFGQIVGRLGRHLTRRGLTAATSEWNLMTASHNLLKLFRAQTLHTAATATP